jgi:GTP-dependent phosphoenolpyruvate carboxykinase
MTTESFIKSLERFLTPQLNEIKGELKAINTRIDALDEKMDIKITALDEKVDLIKSELKADIEHLNEKVDLMNKFNERLFNLIHPAGQK